MNNTTATRTFTAARKAQGFRSQAHLDAFYAYYDHTQACTDCGPGKSVFIDDTWQPTRYICPVAQDLSRAQDLFNR